MREQATWRAVDITQSDAADRLAEAMDAADAVVHLASGFQPSHDPAYLRRLDIGGTHPALAGGSSASPE